jgi:pimeloyl-ACP methyl ester carboxylesterase
MSRARIPHRDHTIELEYEWLFADRSSAPLLLFLHEGLGSIGLWRDFPRRLCEAGGFRGLVYSREGYGRSTPRPENERWPVDFMHRQAQQVLPAFLEAVGVDTRRDPPWLFGHSDGGSISLLYAASFPDALRGAIVLAPHIFVEDLSVSSIRQAREAYLGTDLRAKLARYHEDVDSAFWGWNDIWLDPAFRSWNIEALLPRIRCPLLAIQGENDEYGTMAQIEGIRAGAPQTQLLKLADCGHSPHRDQAEQVIAAVTAFVNGS